MFTAHFRGNYVSDCSVCVCAMCEASIQNEMCVRARSRIKRQTHLLGFNSIARRLDTMKKVFPVSRCLLVIGGRALRNLMCVCTAAKRTHTHTRVHSNEKSIRLASDYGNLRSKSTCNHICLWQNNVDSHRHTSQVYQRTVCGHREKNTKIYWCISGFVRAYRIREWLQINRIINSPLDPFIVYMKWTGKLFCLLPAAIHWAWSMDMACDVWKEAECEIQIHFSFNVRSFVGAHKHWQADLLYVSVCAV